MTRALIRCARAKGAFSISRTVSRSKRTPRIAFCVPRLGAWHAQPRWNAFVCHSRDAQLGTAADCSRGGQARRGGSNGPSSTNPVTDAGTRRVPRYRASEGDGALGEARVFWYSRRVGARRRRARDRSQGLAPDFLVGAPALSGAPAAEVPAAVSPSRVAAAGARL